MSRNPGGPTVFWAHSDPHGLPLDAPGSQAQRLAEHLANVSALAQSLASGAAPADFIFQSMARSAGMLHDLGKYTACFQKMIAGARIRCPHSIHGALAALEDPTGRRRARAYPISAVIAAHHGGLLDRREFNDKLISRERDLDRAALRAFWPAALSDQPRVLEALDGIPAAAPRPGVDLQVRMLLSCLVDADRLDTAGRGHSQQALNSDELLRRLNASLQSLERKAMQQGTPAGLLSARAAVQQACRSAATGEDRLLSLSVPTGAAKL